MKSMFLRDLIFALFFALLFVVLFGRGFRLRGPWKRFSLLFAVVFLATWAGGVWLTPVGPVLWGGYWLPFLIVGLVVSLLLAATVAAESDESTVELVDVEQKEEDKKAIVTALGVFFWVLVVALVVGIVIRYVWRS
jgi:flagellar biosynthesis protein FliQ